MLRSIWPYRAMLLGLMLMFALTGCAAKPLEVRAEVPICPAPPEPPKALTDPVDLLPWMTGSS